MNNLFKSLFKGNESSRDVETVETSSSGTMPVEERTENTPLPLVADHHALGFAGADHAMQDSYGVRITDDLVLAAVADGVTHSFRSKTLADRLVTTFTENKSPATIDEWQRSWTGLRNEWFKEHSPQFPGFHPLEQSLFLDPGCHSTFYGIRIERSEDGSIKIDAFRRGDAIALWIGKEGDLVLKEPDVEFGRYPKTLGLPVENLNWDGFQAIYPSLPAHDLLLLSDTVAEYLLERLQAPLPELMEMLLRMDPDDFEMWCKEQKNLGLKDDDYAFVAIRFSAHLPIDRQSRPKEVSRSAKPHVAVETADKSTSEESSASDESTVEEDWDSIQVSAERPESPVMTSGPLPQRVESSNAMRSEGVQEVETSTKCP